VGQLICILGATSTGKSGAAIAVAQAVGGEIISADSMQLYRGLIIGTGAVTEAEAEGIPHHLLGCCPPDIRFSAGSFQRAADMLIHRIQRRGRMPIVAGGTGLYLRALLRGMADVGIADNEIRVRLQDLLASRGLKYLYRMLEKIDPLSADRLEAGDTQRIVRALEYRLAAGDSITEAIAEHSPKKERYASLKIGLRVERSLLHKRIERRVEQMLAEGWVDEVRQLLESGVTTDSPALRAIGYQQIVEHITKEVPLGVTKEKIIIATRQYAKRQETWFKKENNVFWVTAVDPVEMRREVLHLVDTHLNN